MTNDQKLKQALLRLKNLDKNSKVTKLILNNQGGHSRVIQNQFETIQSIQKSANPQINNWEITFFSFLHTTGCCKLKKIYQDSLDSISSLSTSVKIQIMGEKVCLRYKGTTLLGVVNKLFVFKSLLTTPSNVMPLDLKRIFPPII